MKQKNVPKCIREGIFCLMTGALVFAGSTMTVQAEEATEMTGTTGTTGTTGPDPNSSSSSGTDADQVAADLTDHDTTADYGELDASQSTAPVTQDYGQYDQTTYTEVYNETIPNAPTTTSTTTVEYSETNYHVEDPNYYQEIDVQTKEVVNGPTAEATQVDQNNNPVLGPDGNPITANVNNYTETSGYYDSLSDPDNTADPYYENNTTTTTVVTTDDKAVAEATEAALEQEMAQNGGTAGTDSQSNDTNTATETDSNGHVTKMTIITLSDIEITDTFINYTDENGNTTKLDANNLGINEGDTFEVKIEKADKVDEQGQPVLDEKGNAVKEDQYTVTKIDANGDKQDYTSGSLFELIKQACGSSDVKKTYHITEDVTVDGENNYTVTRKVDGTGKETETIVDKNNKPVDVNGILGQTILGNTNAAVTFYLEGTGEGTGKTAVVVDGTDTYHVSKSVNAAGVETVTVTGDVYGTVDPVKDKDLYDAILGNTTVAVTYHLAGHEDVVVTGTNTYKVTKSVDASGTETVTSVTD
ncbi:MAG: hypothetical protein K6G12_05285, partial [Lachnospiraceae bacterium]|nr:hypothetical protein [Lachnospiraceae bacterium]